MKHRFVQAVIGLIGIAAGAQGAAAQEASYDLGPLPEGFYVQWPTAPTITREAEARTAAEFNAAAAVAGTRVLVKAAIPSGVTIGASDIEVHMDEGASVAGLTINKGLRRIRLVGGSYTGRGIMFSYPSTFWPTRVDNPAWVIEDVLLDGVSVHANANSTALNMRGNRLAVVRSFVRGGDYAVYTGTSPGIENQDMILADNVLQSEGDQATVRLVSVRHSVTVDNRIEQLMLTGSKHAYRVHKVCDQVFAARNLLVNAGVMVGAMAGDDIGELWFEDNVIHHRTEDLFNPGTSGIGVLHAANNTAYSARRCFFCVNKPAAWIVHDNPVFAYTPAPSDW